MVCPHPLLPSVRHVTSLIGREVMIGRKTLAELGYLLPVMCNDSRWWLVYCTLKPRKGIYGKVYTLTIEGFFCTIQYNLCPLIICMPMWK